MSTNTPEELSEIATHFAGIGRELARIAETYREHLAAEDLLILKTVAAFSDVLAMLAATEVRP